MTPTDVLPLLRELRELELVERALSELEQSAPAWAYVRTLIDDRLYWLRAVLGEVEPLVMQAAEHLRAAEVLWPGETCASEMAELPAVSDTDIGVEDHLPSSRVH